MHKVCSKFEGDQSVLKISSRAGAVGVGYGATAVVERHRAASASKGGLFVQVDFCFETRHSSEVDFLYKSIFVLKLDIHEESSFVFSAESALFLKVEFHEFSCKGWQCRVSGNVDF